MKLPIMPYLAPMLARAVEHIPGGVYGYEPKWDGFRAIVFRVAPSPAVGAGKDLTFVPLRPERVVEVRYDHMEGSRFRHTAQFVRWRPDRDPPACTFGQLEKPVLIALAEILG